MAERMIGIINPDGYEKVNRVYSPSGDCPTLQARDYKDPVNYHAPKGTWLLGALRLHLRSVTAYTILILTGVSTSPLLYRASRLTTLLLRRILREPLISAFNVLPEAVLYWPLWILLPLN